MANSSISLSAEAEFPHILIRNLSWLEDGMVSLEALAVHLNKQILHPAVFPLQNVINYCADI